MSIRQYLRAVTPSLLALAISLSILAPLKNSTVSANDVCLDQSFLDQQEQEQATGNKSGQGKIDFGNWHSGLVWLFSYEKYFQLYQTGQRAFRFLINQQRTDQQQATQRK